MRIETYTVTWGGQKLTFRKYDAETGSDRFLMPHDDERKMAIQADVKMPSTEAIEEWCPTCRAAPGQDCITRRGISHAARTDRALRRYDFSVRHAPWWEERVEGENYLLPVIEPEWAKQASRT